MVSPSACPGVKISYKSAEVTTMRKLLITLILIALPVIAVADSTMYFLDVGQGDCTILQSVGETLVIDAGPPEARSALMHQLEACGVERIDVLVLTHPHEDHDANLDYLVDNFKVGQLLIPEYADDEEDYGGLICRAVGQGTQIDHPSVDDRFTVGDASVTVLSAADPAQFPDDKNLWSLVLKIKDGETSIIVCGDAEDINEFAMIDAGLDLDADILRVGHHGSNTSTSGAFVDAVSPDLAIMSCGSDNPYGHPHKETLNTLVEHSVLIMRTDQVGTIKITSDGAAYRVEKEKGG